MQSGNVYWNNFYWLFDLNIFDSINAKSTIYEGVKEE